MPYLADQRVFRPQCGDGEPRQRPTAHKAEKTERGTWEAHSLELSSRVERHTENFEAFNACRSGNVGE